METLEEKFPVNKLLWDEFAISLAEEVQKTATQYGYAKPEERDEKRRSAYAWKSICHCEPPVFLRLWYAD